MPPSQTVGASGRSLDTISMWTLFASIGIAAILFIPSQTIPFIPTKTFVLAAGALLTLAIFILARLSRGNVIFPPLMLVGALWLPTLAYALSAAFSGMSLSQSFWGTALDTDTLGFVLVASVLGTLAALAVRRSENFRSVLRGSAIGFVVLVALQLLVVLVGQVSPSTIAPGFSLIGTYEDLAYVLGLGIIGTLITLRFVDISTRNRQLLLGATVGAMFLLAIANATIAWVLVALVALGLFVESVMRRTPSMAGGDMEDVGTVLTETEPVDSDERGRSMILPLAVLAVSLFFLIGSTLGNALASALHINVVSVRPSWDSTLSIAQKTYSTSPIFGTGPNTFGTEWLKNRDASLNSTVFWNLSFTSGIGFIPTSVITTGIVGALAWLAFIGLFLVLGGRVLLRSAQRDGYVRYAAILTFVSTLYLLTLAVFALPGALVLALVFVCAGLFASTVRYVDNGKQWGIIFSKSPRIGFVIVFLLTLVLLGSVVAAYSLVMRYVATVQLTTANAAITTAGNLETASAAIDKSLTFAPTPAAYQLQAGIANARINQIVTSTTMTPSQAQQAFQSALTSGINAALTATRLAPLDYQNWLVLGNLYAQAVPLGVSGAYDSAKTAYEKALALYPTSPQIHFTLAQLDVANKNLNGAVEYLQKAITLKQDYTAAIFLLSQIEVQAGNVKEALAAALAAAYFTPNDPNILFQVGILRAAAGDLQGSVQALRAVLDISKDYANARYFLSVVLAKAGDLPGALVELQKVAELSTQNASAVAAQITGLKSGRNPFPANLLAIPPTSAQ